MPLRGPRRGRGQIRGRAQVRGRGRGRGGRTVLWEWESYTPGPEVYEQLWRIRKEPAFVTPWLPDECPILNAHTRILDRRQTEGEIQRNFYTIEITPSSTGHAPTSNKEDVVEVDMSRILQYVSPQQLEDFENEQFRIEAAAEAEVLRLEAEELARRRLEKNARIQGGGKGSRMLSGLGLDPDAPRRGRPRGRGRGRGRASWRGRVAPGAGRLQDEDTQQDLADIESLEASDRQDDVIQRRFTETESEEEDSEEEKRVQASPGIMRSAFVANSALPISPVPPHQRLSALYLLGRERDEFSDSDPIPDDTDTRSMSSAAVQLRLEDRFQGETFGIPDEQGSSENGHRSKKRRTESTASSQRMTSARFAPPSKSDVQPSFSIDDSLRQSPNEEGASEDSADESAPVVAQSASHHPLPHNTLDSISTDTINVQLQNDSSPPKEENGETEAEEYVIETISEHFYDGKKKYYLVKWEGYEDSYDWLPEEDLQGAAELVEEYNERIKRGNLKQKGRAR